MDFSKTSLHAKERPMALNTDLVKIYKSYRSHFSM